MQTLIVSRTRSGSGDQRCIGGIALDNGKLLSVRLLNPDTLSLDGSVTEWEKGFWPASSPYYIGGIWELELEDLPNVEPPHIEDKVVRDAQKLRSVDAARLENWLRRNAPKLQPPMLWKGGPWNLFDRKLKSNKRADGKGYASHEDIPARSTGFWIPDRDLVLEDPGKREYRYQRKPNHFGVSRLTYVGEPAPVPVIRQGSLVRVSLARWKQLGDYPNACWLMMSGWY